jgi:hypothetical protein
MVATTDRPVTRRSSAWSAAWSITPLVEGGMYCVSTGLVKRPYGSPTRAALEIATCYATSTPGYVDNPMTWCGRVHWDGLPWLANLMRMSQYRVTSSSWVQRVAW